MGRKHHKQYGTFVTKQAWYLKRKFITVASIVAAVLISSGALAYKLYQDDQEKKLASVLQIPQATASEMPGWWYKDYFGSSVCEQDNCKAEADPDNDKLTNAQEFYYHSHPLNRDTNGNGLTDGEDVALNFDPSKPGKVTFEEAASDENILGESLVFNEDVKTILNETASPRNVKFKSIKDEELNISTENSGEAVVEYIKNNHSIIEKYFPAQLRNSLKTILESGDEDAINNLKFSSARAVLDLKKLKTPSPAVQLHKYTILFFELLPVVINPPNSAILENELDPTGNFWYDQTQAFLVVNQYIEMETKRLENLYQ